MAIATDHGILAAAKTPTGGQRFYPVGQHPATYRMREQLRRLKKYDDVGQLTDGGKQALDYIEGKLTEFEEGEHREKKRYLEMTRGCRRT